MKPAGRTSPAYFLYHNFWTAVDWLFPPACGGCGQIGIRWCEACQKRVHRITGPVCILCGEPLADELLCSTCQDHVPSFVALRSFAGFEGPLREALHHLKYQSDVGLGEALSKHLIELYNQLKWDVDAVVPVPLSRARLKERGYNQSALLAIPLAHAIQKPYQPGLLQRTRDTRSQVGLNATERLQNVEGAFKAFPEQVRGRTVLVIDDVTTTGSTINACAQALRQAGASAVYGMTLARALLQADVDDQPKPSI